MARRTKHNTGLMRLARWEELVNGGRGWMEAWDEVVRDREIGIGRHCGRGEPMSGEYLQRTWTRAMERHCPEVLERITTQARLSLAAAAGPAVRTVVSIADPGREATHRDFAGGEKNKLDAAKFVLGSLGVGPEVHGSGGGPAVQVNVQAGGNGEVREVLEDPELHAEWMALQRKARERRAKPVDAEVRDAG